MATFTLEQGTDEFKQYMSEQKIQVPLEYSNPLPVAEMKQVYSSTGWTETGPPDAQHWRQLMRNACDSVVLTLHTHSAAILESGRTCYWNVKSGHTEAGHGWLIEVVRYNPEAPSKEALQVREEDTGRLYKPDVSADQADDV